MAAEAMVPETPWRRHRAVRRPSPPSDRLGVRTFPPKAATATAARHRPVRVLHNDTINKHDEFKVRSVKSQKSKKRKAAVLATAGLGFCLFDFYFLLLLILNGVLMEEAVERVSTLMRIVQHAVRVSSRGRTAVACAETLLPRQPVPGPAGK